jgi:hypothetical protein
VSKRKRRNRSRHACPLCADPPPERGLPVTIPFGIPTYWPPEAALAIFEFIDEMRDERARRSLERRLQGAHIGRFKPLCDFDWNWPEVIDRATFEALMTLDFLKDATNAVLVGPNGIGKSTLARNLAHEALIRWAAAPELAVLRDYTETLYAADTWKSRRRVVARIEATYKGLDTRYVVTNIIGHCAPHDGSTRTSTAHAARPRT